MAFIMHLVVPQPDGPIVSGPGPVLHPDVAPGFNRPTFGIGGRYQLACDAKLVPDGVVHRMTDSHTPSVSCAKCKETDVFKKKHGAFVAAQNQTFDVAVSELPDGCC